MGYETQSECISDSIRKDRASGLFFSIWDGLQKRRKPGYELPLMSHEVEMLKEKRKIRLLLLKTLLII